MHARTSYFALAPAGGWIDAANVTSLVVGLPDFAPNATDSLFVVVRATNRAGLNSLASSVSLDVDRARPVVERVAVGGFVRGEGALCVLNRTENLLVSWVSDDVGSGLRRHLVVPAQRRAVPPPRPRQLGQPRLLRVRDYG